MYGNEFKESFRVLQIKKQFFSKQLWQIIILFTLEPLFSVLDLRFSLIWHSISMIKSQ
jgi:hypothetical protein